MLKFDVVVIGAGPGGYHSALALAKQNKKVLVIEKDKVGGVCLNRGCIPTKALLYATKVYNDAKDWENLGIKIEKVNIPFLNKFKEKSVKKLVKGVEFLFKKYGVAYFKGEASFIDETKIYINKQKIIESDYFIIATGTIPSEIPALQWSNSVLSIDSFMDKGLEDIKKVVIVGAGVSGLELATILNRISIEVIVVEKLDVALTGIPDKMKNIVIKKLKKLGVEFYFNSVLKKKQNKFFIESDNKDVINLDNIDKVIVAAGRKPAYPHLTGLTLTSKGFIKTDALKKTSVKNIFAIGDVTGPPLMAHKAMKDGLDVASYIVKSITFKKRLIPSVIYTDPPIAFVGKQTNETIEFPYIASGRSTTMNNKEGFVSLFLSNKKIVGAGIVGPESEELISYFSQVILNPKLGQHLEEIVFPHPTLSEMIGEILELKNKGFAIHI